MKVTASTIMLAPNLVKANTPAEWTVLGKDFNTIAPSSRRVADVPQNFTFLEA